MNQDKKYIPIRFKIIISVLVLIFIIGAIFYLMSFKVILKSYKDFEDKVVNININRVNVAIENFKNNQTTKVKDWASWDDSYDFVENNNQDFINENLQNIGLSNLDVNFIAFSDNEGNIIYNKVIDLEKEEDLSSSVITFLLKSNKKIISHNNLDSRVSVIIKTPYGLAILSSLPVLHNDGTGPIAGSIIMGNFLTEKITKEIGDSILYTVEVFSYDDDKLTDDVIIAKDNLSKKSNNFIKVLPNDKVAGYSLIYGIDDNPIGISKVTLPRDFYNQGHKTFNTFILILGITLLIFCLVIVFLIERLIVSKLTELSKQVRSISKEKDLSKKITVYQEDEIGTLADDINTMLRDLDSLQKKERESIALEKKATEDLKIHMEETEKLNKLMVSRELKMIEMKKELEELRSKLNTN